MVARKRGHEEMDSADPAPPSDALVTKLRNTWQFANLMQYIYIFGKAVKIDENLDIEDLERECCMPEPSNVLSDIGLALLKYVSSHRGLTPEIFDEYTRRQYVAKAPQRNPFGEEEEPRKFAEFDVFTKLKVLVQLSQWTLGNVERIREKMEERGEGEQSGAWRINEIGYDRHDRYYFVLDDNRLYRRTEAPLPPPPAPKPKSKSKKAKASARASKRRKTRQAEESANDADIETPQPEEPAEEIDDPEDEDAFGGRKWECIAITMGEYQEFLATIEKSRDANEKALYKIIMNDVMPVIEQAEASQLRKKQRQEREMLNVHKLATAKRSSRLEAKLERERQERGILEAEQKRKAELADAEAYQRRQEKMEHDRESRMMTREQRLKEREVKRILNEQELARMSEEEKKVDNGESRLSERHLKAEMEKKKKELAALEQYDEWTFDCSKCGKHGMNWDDGTHSVACERCNVWQHSACLGISQVEAERDDFHFVCQDCKRREEDAKKPKIPSLKFRVGHSTSPPDQKPRVVLLQPVEVKKRKLEEADFEQHDRNILEHAEPQHLVPDATRTVASQSTTYGTPQPTTNGQAIYNRGQSATVPRSPSYSANFQLHHQYSAHPIPYPIQNRPDQTTSNHYGGPAPNQSFQPPPFLTNGHHQRPVHAQQNNFQTFQPPYQPRQNGYLPSSKTQEPPRQPNLSARYVPSPSHHFSSVPNGLPPTDHRPQVNTSNENSQRNAHRPSSNHGHGKTLPSPLQNAPTLSPPQYKTPNQSFNAPPVSTPPQTNGLMTNNSTYEPVGPPSQSPIKQASPPAPHAVNSKPPSASPISHQPALRPNGPVSPGYSPVKQASLQQQPPPPGNILPKDITALPPVTKLAPSPVQHHATTGLGVSASSTETMEAPSQN